MHFGILDSKLDPFPILTDKTRNDRIKRSMQEFLRTGLGCASSECTKDAAAIQRISMLSSTTQRINTIDSLSTPKLRRYGDTNAILIRSKTHCRLRKAASQRQATNIKNILKNSTISYVSESIKTSMKRMEIHLVNLKSL